ncbi:MAG: undecaprenyl-phosphate glucose phosphotransferase [Alphaproteobacteria bacterium]
MGLAGDLLRLAAAALRLGDVVIVGLVAVLAYWWRHDELALPAYYFIAIVAAVLLTANYFHFAGLYDLQRRRNFAQQVGRLVPGWTAVILTLLALAFLTKTSETYSRAWMLAWFPGSFAALVLLRMVLAAQLSRWADAGRLSERVVVVGAGDYGQRLVRELLTAADRSIAIVGVFDRRRTRVPDSIDGIPVRGDLAELTRFVRANRVDQVIIALPWRAGGTLMEMIQDLRSMPVSVKWCPETIAFQLPVRSLSSVAGVPMIDIFDRPLRGWSRIAKALEDRIGAAILLVLLSPLMVVIAAAIRLDSAGPALFRQKRYGFNNNEITVYKFRTMRADSSARDGAGSGDIQQARRGDPRVTRIGRFLRLSSLDELPQLFNVLRGEMSLVGPRPHAVAHNEHYARIIDQYFGRHRVKPGITGWAQVNGLRGETDTPEKMRQRVEYDLYYIDNWSLLFDFRILFLTLFTGFVNRNAY